MSGLVLALQSPGAAPSGASESELNLIQLAFGSPASIVVLSILLLFSAAAWAIIAMKSRQFSRAERQTAQFLDIFRRSSSRSLRFSRRHMQSSTRSCGPTSPRRAKHDRLPVRRVQP
jgi:hypothetical protein